MIYPSVLHTIGNTPLVKLEALKQQMHLHADLFAKLEYFNPFGSVKDRTALYMVRQAEQSRILQPGSHLIEATSGNTGISLAAIGTMKGYHVSIAMPDNMSIERQKLLRHYGADLLLTDHRLGMKGALDAAHEILQNTPNAVMLDQFHNPANVHAHYDSTGPEIFSALQGQVDCFVAGIGTGGTITGVGSYLKEHLPNVYIVGVEPASSPYLTRGISGPHAIPGIGAGFIPPLLDRSLIDEICPISDQAAQDQRRALSLLEGIFSGLSSGAVLSAAVAVARREEMDGKRIVVLFPDSGSRYLANDL